MPTDQAPSDLTRLVVRTGTWEAEMLLPWSPATIAAKFGRESIEWVAFNACKRELEAYLRARFKSGSPTKAALAAEVVDWYPGRPLPHISAGLRKALAKLTTEQRAALLAELQQAQEAVHAPT